MEGRVPCGLCWGGPVDLGPDIFVGVEVGAVGVAVFGLAGVGGEGVSRARVEGDSVGCDDAGGELLQAGRVVPGQATGEGVVGERADLVEPAKPLALIGLNECEGCR